MKADHRAIARAYLDPARPFDRHHYYYALSKLTTDPLYDGVCERVFAAGFQGRSPSK